MYAIGDASYMEIRKSMKFTGFSWIHWFFRDNPSKLAFTKRNCHDDVIKWKHFPRNWPFVRGIHRSPVNSTHKGQWRGALMFSLICARINGWVNNGGAGDLRRYRVHCDVIVMCVLLVIEILWSSTKLTFALMCVFHVFDCALSVYHFSSHWIRVFTLRLRCYRAPGELKVVSNRHIVNTKNPEHKLAPICLVNNLYYDCHLDNYTDVTWTPWHPESSRPCSG